MKNTQTLTQNVCVHFALLEKKKNMVTTVNCRSLVLEQAVACFSISCIISFRAIFHVAVYCQRIELKSTG